jgi:large subunit ribosomal protein L31
MKQGIHPDYVEATVTCACGNTWTTRSTKATIRTDLCSKCHPYFTGEQRIVDTAGQVDRFMRRFQRASVEPRRNKRAERAAARRARIVSDEEAAATLSLDGEELPTTIEN